MKKFLPWAKLALQLSFVNLLSSLAYSILKTEGLINTTKPVTWFQYHSLRRHYIPEGISCADSQEESLKSPS
jgi:hypothetical protein